MHMTSLSSMMVPHLNLVVFYYKTTTWSCLSWTACSQVCSRTSSCFGACYHSSFPESLATLSHRFVLQLFFLDMWVWSILFLTRFESQADMMVVTFPTLAFCSQLAPPLCKLPMGYSLSNCCSGSSSKVVLPWVPSISDDKQIIHRVVFNKVVHIIHSSPSVSFSRTPSNDRLWIALGWYREFQWSMYQK